MLKWLEKRIMLWRYHRRVRYYRQEGYAPYMAALGAAVELELVKPSSKHVWNEEPSKEADERGFRLIGYLDICHKHERWFNPVTGEFETRYKGLNEKDTSES